MNARLAPSATTGAVPAPRMGGAVAFALVVLAAAVLLVAEVRLAVGDTRSEAEVGTVRIGTADALDTAGTRLAVHVEGEDGLTEALRRELPRAVGAIGVFAGVDVLSAPPSAADRPALVVGVASQELFWTPVYATGKVRVAFAYASDPADVSWRDDAPIVLVADPAAAADGRVRVSDTTRGLISWPAYRRYLGREAAVRVAEQLRSVVLTSPGGSPGRREIGESADAVVRSVGDAVTVELGRPEAAVADAGRRRSRDVPESACPAGRHGAGRGGGLARGRAGR